MRCCFGTTVVVSLSFKHCAHCVCWSQICWGPSIQIADFFN